MSIVIGIDAGPCVDSLRNKSSKLTTKILHLYKLRLCTKIIFFVFSLFNPKFGYDNQNWLFCGNLRVIVKLAATEVISHSSFASNLSIGRALF